MRAVQRLGVRADLVESRPDPSRDDASLAVALEPFAVLDGSTRLEPGRPALSIDIHCPGDAWSLELIEAEVLGEVDRIIHSDGAQELFGEFLHGLAEHDDEVTEIATADLEVELGGRLWRRFSAVSDTRPEQFEPPGEPLDPRVRHELQELLEYVRHCGESADKSGRQDIRNSTLAYLGGALTTLLHLGHIDEQTHSEWHQRLVEALGEPPGGWRFQGW